MSALDGAITLAQVNGVTLLIRKHLYLNMARLNLAFGFTSEALRYLRRGKMIDPANADIEAVMQELGLRVSPVLVFLPRRHVLNRWLGNARHFFLRRFEVNEHESAAA